MKKIYDFLKLLFFGSSLLINGCSLGIYGTGAIVILISSIYNVQIDMIIASIIMNLHATVPMFIMAFEKNN